MSKKKGLSLEEKKSKMLELFYEKKEFFQLKELEKIAPKEKGIVYQSVKEVVQNLVDDGLVDSDKIGTFMCYWAFPSKAMNTRKHKLDDIDAQLAEGEARFTQLEKDIETNTEGKEDTEERRNLLTEYAQLEAEHSRLTSDLDRYKEFDPKMLEQLKKDVIVARDSANRWTDNIISIKQWCKAKFSVEESALNKQFDIPDDMDYVE